MTYHIIETREFYGPRKETSTVVDYFGNPEAFESREAAETWIAEVEALPYRTAHGESGRPSYTIRATAKR